MLHENLSSIRKTLQDGVEKGYWRLEDLDRDSPGLQLLKNEMQMHRVYELRDHQFPEHRNLLRDYHPEAVQAAPDPRDFAEPGSGIRSDHAPLSVEGGISPLVSNGDHQLQHEPSSRSSDSEGQAELGTTGEHAARGSGMPLDW